MKSGNMFANMNKEELLPQTHSLTLSCNSYFITCNQTHYFTVAQICFSWNSVKAPVPVSLFPSILCLQLTLTRAVQF